MTEQIILDFAHLSDTKKWIIVDDVVMGGISSGSFNINADGHGVFEGDVSLANNGGFSSVRCTLGETLVAHHSKVVITVRGDGKRYQFRMKARSHDPHAYIMHFTTTGEWQEIEIPLGDLHPTFRGRELNMPNFAHKSFEEIAFLIANKKAEHFRLEIDKIALR